MVETPVRIDCRGPFRRLVGWSFFALLVGLALGAAASTFLTEELDALGGRRTAFAGGVLLAAIGVAGIGWAASQVPRWVEFGSSIRFGHLLAERVVEWGQVVSLSVGRDETLVLPAGGASEWLGLSFALRTHTLVVRLRSGVRRVPIRMVEWEQVRRVAANRGIEVVGDPAEPPYVL